MEAEERPSKMRKLSRGAIEHERAIVQPFNKPEDGLSEEVERASSEGEQIENQKNADFPDCAEDEVLSAVERVPRPSDMSKNAWKKLQKKAEWESARDYRKIKRKEKIQAKKARDRAAKVESTTKDSLRSKANSNPAKRAQRHIRLPVTFLIDCSFDDLMMEKERISLGSQLTRCYSDNSRAPFQAHMVVSSWGGLLRERFDTILAKHHENWKGVVFTERSFVEAAEAAKEAMKGKHGGEMAGIFIRYKLADQPEADLAAPGAQDTTTSENEKASQEEINVSLTTNNSAPANGQRSISTSTTRPSQSGKPAFEQGEVIYLTSDSPHTLEELKPYSTYIIGGLVDKNRHKGICYKTACHHGIRTAKLPIGDFMEMQSRFVLAVNHVMEIMVRWLECGDWGEAFLGVIPKRKGGKLQEPDTTEASTRDDAEIRRSSEDQLEDGKA